MSAETHSAGWLHRCVFNNLFEGVVLQVESLEGTALASLGNVLEMQFLGHTPDILSQKFWGWHPTVCV